MTKNDATDVEGIKRKARLLSRETGTPHRQALDLVAKAAGYSHWGSYRTALETANPPPGWRRHGEFTIYPPLMHGILSDDDVTCLAVNHDGSAWKASGDRDAPTWTRLHSSEIDRQDVLRDFMDSIPVELHNASGLTFLTACDRSRPHRHDDRLVARTSSPRNGTVEITVRKGPRKDDPRLAKVGDWGMERRDWHAHLFSTRIDGAIRRACDHVTEGQPDSTRLVTFGIRTDERRHPNGVEASARLYDDQIALDYGMRICGDAFVAIADTPARAVAAINLANSNHGPVAVLVDADPENVIGHLMHLANAGNVHPMRHVRDGLAEAIALLPERSTLHV